MIELKDGVMTRVVPDPRLLSDKEKEKAREYEYVCSCNRELKYRFGKDLRFYPLKNEYASMHKDYCIFSEVYQKRHLLTIENILKPLSNSESSGGGESESSGGKSDRMRVLEHIKELNYATSAKQASSFTKKVRSFYEFSRWVFMGAKEVMIGEDLSLNPGTPRFFYEKYKGVRAYEGDKLLSSPADMVGKNLNRCNLITTYPDKNGKICEKKWLVTRAAMKSALKNYFKKHEDIGENVIATGYEYDLEDRISGRIKKRVGRLWLFDTSKDGIYVESAEEAECHDYMSDYARSHSNIRYYAQDKGGVILLDNTPVKCVIGIGGHPKRDDGDLFFMWNKNRVDEMVKKLNKGALR